MKIIAINGSSSPDSSNYRLLLAIQELLKEEHEVLIYSQLHEFDLFTVARLQAGIPENIQHFKELLASADAAIICTPEYTHNIPAVLKNMLEWCTHSGEFNEKPILPITFTPYEPRGKYAMQSLVKSLQTLKAKMITEFPLYKTDVIVENDKVVLPEEIKEMIREVVGMM